MNNFKNIIENKKIWIIFFTISIILFLGKEFYLFKKEKDNIENTVNYTHANINNNYNNFSNQIKIKENKINKEQKDDIEIKETILFSQKEDKIYENLLSIELSEKNRLKDYMLNIINKENLEIFSNRIMKEKDNINEILNNINKDTNGLNYLKNRISDSIEITKGILYHINYGTKKNTIKDIYEDYDKKYK